SNSPSRLAYWRFETPSWTGEEGQLVLAATNIQSITDGSNHVLRVNAATPANLKYRDVETNGSPNIDVANGSISFWFHPDWTSAGASGSGPGQVAQLVSIGQESPDANRGCWNISIS